MPYSTASEILSAKAKLDAEQQRFIDEQLTAIENAIIELGGLGESYHLALGEAPQAAPITEAPPKRAFHCGTCGTEGHNKTSKSCPGKFLQGLVDLGVEAQSGEVR